jgi:polar amino acid transport system substrate-binding protein
LSIKNRVKPTRASQLPRGGRPLVAVIAVFATLGLTAAGSSAKPAGHASERAHASSASALLPASIRSAGVITMGSDISFPPMEYYKGSTPVGFDIDLGDAIAKQLGVKAKWVNTSFTGIIPALQAQRFDLILSSMTDSKAREGTLNFVDYLNVGSSLLVQKGNPKHLTTLNSVCGTIMAGQTGTNAAMIADQEAARCKKEGKPAVTLVQYPSESQVVLAIEGGRADAAAIDYVGAVGFVEQDHGKNLAVASNLQSDKAPYGIGILKSDTQLTKAVHVALKALIKNGTYKKLLAKWHIQASSLTSASINGAVS